MSKEKPVFYLFYPDSALRKENGHGHLYVSKETYLPVDERELPSLLPDGSYGWHAFYFSRKSECVPADREDGYAWFVDGNWAIGKDLNGDFVRYRDPERKGWHIVQRGTRFVDFEGRKIDLCDRTEFESPAVEALGSGVSNEELIMAYTLFQQDVGTAVVLRGKRLKDHELFIVREAWSKRLREMVKASDKARKEADRLQVICQGDWLDD